MTFAEHLNAKAGRPRIHQLVAAGQDKALARTISDKASRTRHRLAMPPLLLVISRPEDDPMQIVKIQNIYGGKWAMTVGPPATDADAAAECGKKGRLTLSDTL